VIVGADNSPVNVIFGPDSVPVNIGLIIVKNPEYACATQFCTYNKLARYDVLVSLID
jgi:hypothetical protein